MTDQQLSAIAGLTQAVEKHTDQTIQAVQLIHQAREELETAQGSFLQRDEQAADSRKLAGLTVSQLQTETVKQVRAEHGNVISPPTVSGSNSVIINQQATLTVTADSHLNQVAIADFTLTRPDGSTDTVAAVNGQATFTPPVAGAVGSKQTFKVSSTDSLGNISTPAEYVISIIDNQAPVMDGFSYSVPSIAIRGETITARFLGATDPDGNDSQVTYRIVDTLGVTAGKTSGIGHNEAVTLTVDQISADMTGRITVKAVDAAGVQSGGVVIPLDLRARAVVEAPSAISPTDGSADMDRQPFLSWSSFATNPSGFDTHQATRLQVATDTGFSDVVVDMTVGAVTTAQIDQQLQAGTRYYWRVQVQGKTLGWSEWSYARGFSTQVFTAAVGILGGARGDYFRDVAVGSSGHVFAVGSENSTGSYNQALIAKYDADLNLLKQVNLGGSNHNVFQGVVVDSSDYVFAVGNEASSVGNYQALIAKYDADLNLLKQVKLGGGSHHDYFQSVVADSSGNVFAAGYESSSTGRRQALIAKYDADLSLLKQVTLGGSDNNRFHNIVVDSSGNVFAVGDENSSTDYGQALIAKYDADLNLSKQVTLGGSNYDGFYDVVVDSSDHVFAVGYDYSSTGHSQSLITKYDADLNLSKQVRLVGSDNGCFHGIVVDNSGHVFAVGSENSSTDYRQALITKYDADMNLSKQVMLGGSNYDGFYDVVVDHSGHVFAVGYEYSSTGHYQALIAAIPNDLNITAGALPDIPALSWSEPNLTVGTPNLTTGNPNLSVGNPNLTTGDPGLSIGNPNLTETRSEY